MSIEYSPCVTSIVKSGELVNDVVLVAMVTFTAKHHILTLAALPQHSENLWFLTGRVGASSIMLNSLKTKDYICGKLASLTTVYLINSAKIPDIYM